MADGQIEGNSAAAVAEPQTSGQSAPVVSETPSQSGQATTQVQSAPAEESFSNIDPKTLPPELQAVYKNLQADYTKKSQSNADVRKKADQFDQISKDQRFVSYWNGLDKQQKADFKEQKQEAEKLLGEKISDEFFSKSFETKDGFLDLIAKVVEEKQAKSQKKIEELEKYKTVTEASNVVEAFATEQGPDGKPLRPDFYELDDPKLSLVTGYLSVNPPGDTSPQAYQTKLAEAYQWAKGVKDHFYSLGKTEALKIIQQKAATSTNPPTQAAKGAYTGPDPKKMSVREAMDLAKKGIKVPTQYD